MTSGSYLRPEDFTDAEWVVAVNLIWAAPDDQTVAEIRLAVDRAVTEMRKAKP